MPITHIITDNDGVNIDSEDLAMRIMDDWGVNFIRQHNPEAVVAADYIYSNFAGKSTDKIVRALIEEFKLSAEDIRSAHNLADDIDIGTHMADIVTIDTIKRFSQELKSIPGTTEAWTALREQYGAENIALATTSRSDRMDVSVNRAVDPATGENARLHEFFPEGDRRFSGYGGPNKYDAFFATSGWNPAESVIVEDSLSGARYAKDGRPDIKVIGTVAANFYTDKHLHAMALIENGADVVISTMHDLPVAVQWINEGMDPKNKPDFAGKVYSRQPLGGGEPSKIFNPGSGPSPG